MTTEVSAPAAVEPISDRVIGYLSGVSPRLYPSEINWLRVISWVLMGVAIPLSPALAAGPVVLQVRPVPLSMDAGTSPDVVVQFDQAIDPSSVDGRSMAVFGRFTGVCPGDYLFEDGDRRVRFVPSGELSAGEWTTVSLSKGIRSALGESMETGYVWNFWTAAARGGFDLVEVGRIEVREEGEGPITTYGAYAGDLDGDGFQDFTVPNEDADDIRVFLNDGTGGYSDFTIYTLPPNSTPSTNEGADFNGDGLLDFAVGNIQGGTTGVFFGDGTGGFLPAQIYPTDSGTRGLCVLDADGDGDPDIFTSNREGSTVSLLQNAGDGTFPETIVMDTGMNGETSCAAADANGDGILDLFVGAYGSDEILVLLGDGNGRFALSAQVPAGGDAWMIAAGDVDGDGDVDVVSANSGQNRFSVLRGDGQGNLSPPESYVTGLYPLSMELGDIDGDGDLDAVTSNFSSADWTIFENAGDGTFTNRMTLDAADAGSCCVLHDRDGDGDTDFTGIDEIQDLLFLFQNQGPVLVDDEPTADPIEPNDAGAHRMQSWPDPSGAKPLLGTSGRGGSSELPATSR